MLAPLAPHVAEELWSRLGHADTLTYEDSPVADPTWLVVDAVEIPVQVNGKVRGTVEVSADADDRTIEDGGTRQPHGRDVARREDGREGRGRPRPVDQLRRALSATP